MSEKRKQAVHYSFTVSESEDAIIRGKMKLPELKNQSAYLRGMALNGYLLKPDLPELQKAVSLIGRLDSNVNSILSWE